MLLPFLIGTTLGRVAGYYGRFGDTVITRLVEVVVAFPFFVLIIAMVFVLGPGTRNIYLAITLVGWVSYCRIIRGEVLVAKRQEYILAAQAAGLSNPRIIVRHLLPERHHPGHRVRDVRHRARHPARSSRSATWASASSRRHPTGER